MLRVLDPFRFVLMAVTGWMNRRQLHAIDYLREENRVLREQLGTRRLRFSDDQRRWLAARAKGLGRKLPAEIATIVMPETLLAWHRKLIAQKYDGSAKRGPGRPRRTGEIEALVVRMARENRDWGYRRIQGALSNLGVDIARSTIAAILERHGMGPAPERNRQTTWREFLARHWDMIVTADFFTVEVRTRHGLQRFIVLFFLELSTRRVDLALEFAGKGRTDPRTLSRASRDFLKKDASFSLKVGRFALQRILEGYGYELTGIDVLDAFDRYIAAAQTLGVDSQARADALAMATQHGGVAGDILIRRCSIEPSERTAPARTITTERRTWKRRNPTRL